MNDEQLKALDLALDKLLNPTKEVALKDLALLRKGSGLPEADSRACVPIVLRDAIARRGFFAVPKKGF